MSIRIALAQFEFPVGAVAQNAQRITAMIAEARDVHGADLVLFPELALSGYPPEDLLLRPSFLRACESALHEIAAASLAHSDMLSLQQWRRRPSWRRSLEGLSRLADSFM